MPPPARLGQRGGDEQRRDAPPARPRRNDEAVQHHVAGARRDQRPQRVEPAPGQPHRAAVRAPQPGQPQQPPAPVHRADNAVAGKPAPDQRQPLSPARAGRDPVPERIADQPRRICPERKRQRADKAHAGRRA